MVNGTRVLSNVIASQDDLHAEYRGVVPEIASRAHAERLLPIVRRALQDAGVALERVDGVAVGHRPGLIGCLLVGVAGAKALAWSLGVPFIGVDHIRAHLYAGCLNAEPPTFPALGPLGLLPAPTKWQIHFGEPIDFAGHGRDAADDELLVGKLAERVRATIQGMLDRAVGARKSVFFG